MRGLGNEVGVGCAWCGLYLYLLFFVVVSTCLCSFLFQNQPCVMGYSNVMGCKEVLAFQKLMMRRTISVPILSYLVAEVVFEKTTFALSRLVCN